MEDVTPLAVLAFLGEVVLLVLLAVAGARLGTGVGAVVLAVALPLVVAAVWARWLSPRAVRPMTRRRRVVAKCVVVVVCTGVVALSGLPLVALVALVVVGPLFVVAELRDEAGHRRPGPG